MVRRLGRSLALFAIALQVVLSATHHHARAAAGGAGAVLAGSHAAVPKGPALPARDACPICAAIHVAGSAVLPQPPICTLPAEITPVVRTPAHAARFATATVLRFQSRAPPAA